MAELFEEVVALLESRSAVRALASQFRIESEQAAGNGAVLGVPVFLASLGRWAEDPSGAETVLSTLKTTETGTLQDPGTAIEARLYEPLGSDLVGMLLNGRRERVAGAIAGEAGISQRSAAALLSPTAWAVMTSIADRYGHRLDRQSLIAILRQEQQDLIDTGWGPWLEATDGKPAGLTDRRSIATMAQAAELDTTSGDYPPPSEREIRSAVDTGQHETIELQRRPQPHTFPELREDLVEHAFLSDPDEFDDMEDPQPSRIPLVAIGLLLACGLGLGIFILLGGDADGAAEGEGNEVAADIDEPTPSTEATRTSPDAQRLDLQLSDPAAQTDASAIAELTIDEANGQICYRFTVEGLPEEFRGLIHAGGAGVEGEAVVDFGPLRDRFPGCGSVDAPILNAILLDPAGHYLALNDGNGGVAIRSQLSDALPPGGGAPTLAFDTNGAGALARLDADQLVLSGEIPDEDTRQQLLAALSPPAGVNVVDEMVVADGAPPPTGRIIIPSSRLFVPDSDQLAGFEGTALEDLAALLVANPNWTGNVVSHTDSSGGPDFNLDLSQRRAESVRLALVENGVAADNLASRGDGDASPIDTNDTREGRANNRRIELEITSIG